MKKIILWSLALILSYISNGQNIFTNPGYFETVYRSAQDVCTNETWKLVFHDEFNGTKLDSNKWITYYPTDVDTFGINAYSRLSDTGKTQQVFLDQNVDVAGGQCNLTQKQENATWYGVTQPYTAGVIHSRQLFRTYSKFEIRCKTPRGAGLWSAFWMFGWSTEIDVFEFNGAQPGKIHSTVHHWFNSNSSTFLSQITDRPDLSTQFHTYGVEFDEDKIVFYLDGVEIKRMHQYYTSAGQPQCNIASGYYQRPRAYPIEPNPLQHNITSPLSVIAGVGISRSTHDGGKPAFKLTAPNAHTPFPNTFEIDYIRVYQRKPQKFLHDLNAPVYVSGDDLICQGIGSMRTYSVHNPSGDDNIVWTTSSNLTIINQSPTTITVAPIGNAGDAWIRATRNGNGALLHSTNKKDIWIGKPAANTVFGAGSTVGCTPLPLSASISSPDILLYQWSVSGGSIVGNSNSANVTVDPINGPYGFTVSVRARNSCGWSNWTSKTYNTNCDGGPNPLRIVPHGSTIDIDLGLYDRIKEVHLVSVVTGASYSLDISESVKGYYIGSFPKGMYYILVTTNEDVIASEKFLSY